MPNPIKNEKLATKVVDGFLDKGLAESTWAEMFPDAFADLKKHYRKDLIEDVRKTLNEKRVR